MRFLKIFEDFLEVQADIFCFSQKKAEKTWSCGPIRSAEIP
jgi:hypothetical protein